jgi:hypothetical protein
MTERLHTGRWGRRNALLLTAIGTCVVLVVAPMFVRPAASTPEVTVTGFLWHFQEGNTSSGDPWFAGTSDRWVNDSGWANGFPIQVPSGGTVEVYVFLHNEDSQTHLLVLVQLTALLRVSNSNPQPPAAIPPGVDFWFQITVSVSAPPGATVFGMGTIGFD